MMGGGIVSGTAQAQVGLAGSFPLLCAASGVPPQCAGLPGLHAAFAQLVATWKAGTSQKPRLGCSNLEHKSDVCRNSDMAADQVLLTC